MSPEEFLTYWRRNYDEAELAGYSLRECNPERWLRIHSLPGSKRYADTDAERTEILKRQNIVFGDLIGEGKTCELVFGYYGEEERIPEGIRNQLRKLRPEFLTTLTRNEIEFPLFRASLSWKQEALDPILLAVADDVLDTPLVVSIEYNRVVAPYDGGVDLIVENAAFRDQLRKRYTPWLSSHPAGL